MKAGTNRRNLARLAGLGSLALALLAAPVPAQTFGGAVEDASSAPANPHPDRPLRTLATEGGRVFSLAFSPDSGSVVLADVDGGLRAYGVDGSVAWDLQGKDGPADPLSVQYTPDGAHLLVGTKRGEVELLAAGTGDREITFESGGEVWSVAVSRDGAVLLSGHEDGKLVLHDPAAAREQAEKSGLDWAVSLVQGASASRVVVDLAARTHSDVVLSRDGTRAYVGTGGLSSVLSGVLGQAPPPVLIQEVDLRTGAVARTFSGHEGPVRSLALSPDGRTLASGSFDRTLRTWSLGGGSGDPAWEEVARFQEDVNGIAYTPDGAFLVAAIDNGNVAIVEVATRAVLELPGHFGGGGDELGHTSCVAVSPDGRFLASGGSGDVRLWDLPALRSLFSQSTE